MTARQREVDELAGRIRWLAQVRLLEEVRQTPEAIASLAGVMEQRHYAKHVTILSEGEQGSEAYFLIAGTIKVLKHSVAGDAYPVAVLEAHQHPFFGEAALVQSDKRSATIRTESACDCLILSRHSFEVFAAKYPHWALPIVMKIARVIMERLHQANDDVVLLYNALVNEVKG